MAHRSSSLLLVILVAACAGCSSHGHGPEAAAAAPAAPAPNKSAQVAPAVVRAPDADNAIKTAVSQLPNLTPLTGRGSGIAVLDPVCADAGLAGFGRGCARWLHLTIGGDPSLASTPLLSASDRVRRELGRQDLALKPDHVTDFASRLGASHVLTAQLQGNETAAVLTLQWVKSSGEAVGAPETLRGNKSEIAAQLPAAAGRLTSALGGKPAQAAQAPDPQTLTVVGGLWWADPASDDTQAPPELAALRSEPLVELLRMRLDPRGTTPEHVKQLLAAAPGNTLVIGDIGYFAPELLKPHQQTVTGLRRTHPDCYALAHASVWLHRVLNDELGEIEAEHDAVRDAPLNPDSWLSLGWSLAQKAERLRKGRYAAQISSAEWAQLEPLYAQSEQAIARATLLDREYAHAWHRLAAAATFASHAELADAAFWASLKLDPTAFDTYSWGLQMYQPKWLNEPEKLKQVAELMSSHDWSGAQDMEAIYFDLNEAGLTDTVKLLATRQQALREPRVKANPGDVNAHYLLGLALARLERFPEARRELQQAVKLDPKHAGAHLKLGRVLDLMDRREEAMQEYRTGLRLRPTDGDAHFYLGWVLKTTRHYDEAVREFKKNLEVYPHNANAHAGLAAAYQSLGKASQADAEYRMATQRGCTDLGAYSEYTTLLVKQKRWDEALEVVNRLERRRLSETAVLDLYSYVYGEKGDSAKSIQYCRQALAVDANDEAAQINLGEGLCKTGHRAEGRSFLLKCADSKNPEAAKEARRLLAKYP